MSESLFFVLYGFAPKKWRSKESLGTRSTLVHKFNRICWLTNRHPYCQADSWGKSLFYTIQSQQYFTYSQSKSSKWSDRGIGRIIIQSLGFQNTIGSSAKPVTPSKSQCSQWLRQPLNLPSKDTELCLIVYQFLHVPFKYPAIPLREKFPPKTDIFGPKTLS